MGRKPKSKIVAEKTDNLMTMTAYAKRIGVSRQRVGIYVSSGQISPKALRMIGKRPMIDPIIADADLSRNLIENGQSKAAPVLANADTGPDEITNRMSKAEADRVKSIAQARHWNVKTSILEGQFVEREWVEQQLAARALLLKQDMENFFRSRAPDIILICEGRQERSPDIIEHLLTNLEIWLGRYSQPIEFGA